MTPRTLQGTAAAGKRGQKSGLPKPAAPQSSLPRPGPNSKQTSSISVINTTTISTTEAPEYSRSRSKQSETKSVIKGPRGSSIARPAGTNASASQQSQVRTEIDRGRREESTTGSGQLKGSRATVAKRTDTSNTRTDLSKRNGPALAPAQKYTQMGPVNTMAQAPNTMIPILPSVAVANAQWSPGAIFGIDIHGPAATTSPVVVQQPSISIMPTEFATSNSRMEHYMSTQPLHKLSTHNLPPPSTTPVTPFTPYTGKESAVSSRTTDTSSPFSRISTPATSLTSPSPALLQTTKNASPRPALPQSPPLASSREFPLQPPAPIRTQAELTPSLAISPIINPPVQVESGPIQLVEAKARVVDVKRAHRAPIVKQDAPALPMRMSSKRLPRPPPAAPSASETEIDDSDAAGYSASELNALKGGLPTRPSRPARDISMFMDAAQPTIIHSNMTRIETTGRKRRESAEQAAIVAPARFDTPPHATSVSPRRKLVKPQPKQLQTSLPRPPSITSPHLYSTTSVRDLHSQLPTRPSIERRDTPDSTFSLSSMRAPSPAVSTASSTGSIAAPSRFGGFMRRTPAKLPTEPVPRLPRKGPAAGTGHEGYGKYSALHHHRSRGRSTSIRSDEDSAAPGRDRSAATTINTSSERSISRPAKSRAPLPGSRSSSFGSADADPPPMDDWFKDRLQPKVISGGGGNIKKGKVYVSSSAASSTPSFSTAGMPSSNVSQEELPVPRLPQTNVTGLGLALPRQTLAHRRSLNKISQGITTDLTVPAPINIKAVANPRSIFARQDNATSSAGWTDGSVPTTAEDKRLSLEKVSSAGSANEGRSKSPMKWGIFKRNNQENVAKAAAISPPTSHPRISPRHSTNASLELRRGERLAGHYGLMDVDDHQNERNLDEILRDIEDNLDLGEGEQQTVNVESEQWDIAVTDAEEDEEEETRKISVLLPSPPLMPARFSEAEFNARKSARSSGKQTIALTEDDETPSHDLGNPRRSVLKLHRITTRLPVAGITTQHSHKPAQASFSRPFAPKLGLDTQVADPTIGLADPFLETADSGPAPPFMASPPSHTPEAQTPSTWMGEKYMDRWYKTMNASGVANAMLFSPGSENQFINYPIDWQTAFAAQMSSSEGTASAGSGSLPNAIHLPPNLRHLRSPPFPPTSMPMVKPMDAEQEEEWREYDELFDLDSRDQSASEQGPQYESRKDKRRFGRQVEKDLINQFPSLSNLRNPSPPKSGSPLKMMRGRNTSRSDSRGSPALPEKPDYIKKPPHLHPEIRQQECEQQTDKGKQSPAPIMTNKAAARRKSLLPTFRQSTASTISGSRYSSHTDFSTSSTEDENAEEIYSETSHSPGLSNPVTRAMARKTASNRDSLRFAALMTSRWLSFDRVLFSPAADEILNNTTHIPTPRILVLDGLANDDWSAYVALTYPAATVYNLSTTPKLRQPSPHGEEWSPPANHRLLPLPSLAHPFPFPKGFFAAVVLRFPPLLPPHHLGNIVAEARRVLRPGGCIEATLLDVDPVNMGPLLRRSVKSVKLRAQEAMQDAHLGAYSDMVVRLLGRKGFEGLKSCTVSVPVGAGDGDSSPSKSDNNPLSEGVRRSEQLNAGRSLLELLREAGDDTPAGLAAQYPVAKTISRVARWWWSRCYEGLGETKIDLTRSPGSSSTITTGTMGHSGKKGGSAGSRASVLGKRGEGEDDERSVWRDPYVLAECEQYETGLRLVLAYAVKPNVQRRRTVSV